MYYFVLLAEPGAGAAVVASGFQPHCRMVAGEEQPLAEPGVDGVEVGAVGCVRPHVEARIAAQDVEAARAQDQARARERRCGRSHAAERRARLGYVPVYLEAEVVTQEKAEPGTRTQLVVELETAIVPRVGAEPADLDLARSEEHTSELQSLRHLVCRLLLEK